LKINYTLYSLALTGGTRSILTLSSYLANRGHEVSITVPERRMMVELPMNRNVRIIGGDVPWLLKLFDPFFYVYSRGRLKTDFIRFEAMLEKIGINVRFDIDKLLCDAIPESDVSAATFSLTAFPVNLAKARAKIYHMQHFETIFARTPYDKKRVLQSYTLPLTRIANSSWLKNKLKKELGVESTCVSWGMDQKVFNTKRLNFDHLSRIFDRSDGTLYVMSLGKSIRWKGLPELFDALKYIKKKRPDLRIKLVLYGNEPRLKELSPVECEYVYSPPDRELVYLYQNSDVVVTASHYESFPAPPLEGMACGTKVVTTPYGVEDYAKSGYNAVIVRPKDVKSLAQGIIKALTDERLGEELKRNGPLTAKRFTWKRSADAIERIYKRALDSSVEEKATPDLI
jgi:glycosyltransferase involved in cell wall biosynthesis